jgi:hypothetical protein
MGIYTPHVLGLMRTLHGNSELHRKSVMNLSRPESQLALCFWGPREWICQYLTPVAPLNGPVKLWKGDNGGEMQGGKIYVGHGSISFTF